MATADSFIDDLTCSYAERFSQPVRDLAEMVAAAREHRRLSDREDLAEIFDDCVEVYASKHGIAAAEVAEAAALYADIAEQAQSLSELFAINVDCAPCEA